MNVGELYAFQALVSGTSDTRVTWSTNPMGVATVSSGGVVSAVTPGTTTIRATSVAEPSAFATATVTVNAVQSNTIEIVVTNALLNAVNVTVNGMPVGSVPASSTRQTVVPRTASVTTGWSLVRTTTTEGVPVGDVISATFGAVTNPGDRINYTIDAVIDQMYIFRPTIANQTGVSLLMGVNEGLQSQNRCGCTVPPFSPATALGYYRLFSNTNVRAYRDGTNYTGGYIYWDSFAPAVDALSGYILLNATFPPSLNFGAALADAMRTNAAMAARESRAPRSDVDDVLDPVPWEAPRIATLQGGAGVPKGAVPLQRPIPQK